MKAAVTRTLAYADVFDYPLTKQEIFRFLISPRSCLPSSLAKALAASDQWEQREGFYFLKGHAKIVTLRQRREHSSRAKLKIARRVAGWLRLIPTIKMVAVTGTLSVNNADRDDDIDLLLVTAKNRLWLTRFLTVVLLETVARRRHPGDRRVKDKICLNMLLDEAYLCLPPKERDLFTAHEVCQLKPIWDKDKIYQKFVDQNQWSQRYLANWKP